MGSTGFVDRPGVPLCPDLSWWVPNKVGTNTPKRGLIWDESINGREGSAIA